MSPLALRVSPVEARAPAKARGTSFAPAVARTFAPDRTVASAPLHPNDVRRRRPR
jgi:hypothetical protein